MLNRTEMEGLEGELLGDSSLVIGKRYHNAAFRLQARSRGQVILAYARLVILGGAAPSRFMRKTVYHKQPVEYWQWRSRRHEVLTQQRRRWYPDGVKIVPEDFQLTPISALHWYVGDGCLRRKSPAITLCTDCFDTQSIRKLMMELANCGFTANPEPHRKGFRIRLGAGEVSNWLSWIGPCPVPSMEYKWQPVFYDRRNPPLSARDKRFIEELLKDGVGYRQIADMVGRSYTTIYSHFWRRRNAGMDTR